MRTTTPLWCRSCTARLLHRTAAVVTPLEVLSTLMKMKQPLDTVAVLEFAADIIDRPDAHTADMKFKTAYVLRELVAMIKRHGDS